MRFSDLLDGGLLRHFLLSITTCAIGFGCITAPVSAQGKKNNTNQTENTMTPASTAKAKNGATAQEIRPFHVNIPDEILADLRRRIVATNWPSQELVPDATQGVQLGTMRKLADYWAKDYDWRKIEAKLKALPQFITNIDGGGHSFHPRSLET